MLILITRTPRGEAPKAIREAWVGLKLPTVSEIVERRCVGVLTRKRAVGFRAWLRRTLSGDTPDRGYLVEAATAIDLLGRINPQAADWWRNHTPHLLQPGRNILFPEECCIATPEGPESPFESTVSGNAPVKSDLSEKQE